MANELTGDFDVVAQFPVPTVNRVLAAMHGAERFPHSFAIRVEDTSGPPRRWPPIVATIDRFGDAIADPGRIPTLPPLTEPPRPGTVSPVGAHVVVNGANGVFENSPIEPSNLKGRAQLQLFPPTIDVTDGAGTNITVRMSFLGRYFADPATTPMAEFIRGEIHITAPVSQVAAQRLNVIEIDIRAAAVKVSFVRQWSSKPLSAEDLAAITQLIRNSLKTSFLPSNSTLPSNIRHMRFRTMQSAGGTVAVLLNLRDSPEDIGEETPGNPASAGNNFLEGGDGFAFGIGSDFIRSAFQPTLDRILTTPVDPVKFTINGVVHTWHITYTIVLNSATVELRNGEFVVTIKGRATTPSWPPNFNFTVTQRLSLSVFGATADLVVGDLSFDTNNWVIDRFRGRMSSPIRKVANRALNDNATRGAIRKMFSADENLGGFLAKLLEPPETVSTAQPVELNLAYTSIDIRPSGIVLHGSLGVREWRAPRAEFQPIPPTPTGPLGGSPFGDDDPDYTALKSWIPGGTIERYEWKSQGPNHPGLIDTNTFVYTKPPPGFTSDLDPAPVSGFVPFCLTLHGSRISPSGPPVAETITASVCDVNSFPVFDVALEGESPLIALAEPDARGMIRVAGHTAARKAATEGGAPNLIVQFGNRDSADKLELVVQALRESGRNDASTAIVAVLSSADLASARYTHGITYADDQDGVWERRFGLGAIRRPMMLIVDPTGKVTWQHEGVVDLATLAEALKKSLVSGSAVKAAMQPTQVRIGQPPPNFLFEYTRGRGVTLRKVEGQPVTVVFWRASSKQSIAAVSNLPRAISNGDGMVLAINDGDPADLARKLFAENKLSATLVTDPERSIALAYGVNSWPTTISIDARGLVSAIRHGHIGEQQDPSTIGRNSAEGAHND